MSEYGNRGDTRVESWYDPPTVDGWGGNHTNEDWGMFRLDEIGTFGTWIDNNEGSWSGTISKEKEFDIQERTELVTQSARKNVRRAFITNDQQRPKSYRNQYKKPKSHDNYQESYKIETHETRPKIFNVNHEFIKTNPQIITSEMQMFDKRVLPSTLPPIVEEWEYTTTSNTSKWENDVTSSFDDTIFNPITVQLSPKNDSQVTEIPKVENVEEAPGKNLYTQCIDLVAKRIKALNKRLAKIEKSEEFLQDPKNRSKLNNDQLQSIEKKEQVIGAIKELEEIYKKIVNINIEEKRV